MAFVYAQSTGVIIDSKSDVVGRGYSGHGDGKNNPALENAHNVGPIPRGDWKIAEMLPEYPPHGPFVLRLEPKPWTNTFGREGFLVHGDMIDPALAGTASLGCIILPRAVRELVWASGDRDLAVID